MSSAGYTTAPPPGAGGPRPEPGVAQLRLAGWWRRVGAALIDGTLIAVVATALFAALAAGLTMSPNDGVGWYVSAVLGALVWLACATVAALLYAPWMMSRTDGKTLGRMAFGIRVVRASGKPMDFRAAVVREVLIKWVLFYGIGGAFTLGILPLVDVLWPLWDEQKRALHDFVARTRTVRG